MKHIISSTLLLLAFSLLAPLAHAMPYWAVANTGAYDKDEVPGSDKSKAAYSGYYCTVDTAAKLFGGSTGSAISDFLSKDYASFSAAKGYGAADGVTWFDSVSFSDGEYALLDYTGAAFASSDYVAIAFYGMGSANGFQVFDSATLTPNGQIVFENDGDVPGGNWHDAPEQVPEPAGGLLLVLGLAGLALRRKRA